MLPMLPLEGFRCFLSAAACYLLSRITGRDVEVFKSVTKVLQLKDLVELVGLESKMVALSGRVGSETPLTSELSGINSVLVEETVEQHFLKRHFLFFWDEDKTLLQPTSKEVPWYLDDETGRVNVAGAQNAKGFTLKFGSEVFENSKPSSFFPWILDILQGIKRTGVKRTERVLPTGTPLTVLGEVVKDGSGDFKIQKPEKGPFCVTPLPINKIIKLENLSRRFKNASIGLAVVGVILISKHVIEYVLMRIEDNRIERIREERQQQLKRQRVTDAAAKRAKAVTRGLVRQHKNSSDGEVPDLCVICQEQKYNAVFIQCGHMCCCITCALKFLGKGCPLCRRQVIQVLKTYLPC